MYQVWQFVTTGDNFAVRREHREPTGICGPLGHSEVCHENLTWPPSPMTTTVTTSPGQQEHQPKAGACQAIGCAQVNGNGRKV